MATPESVKYFCPGSCENVPAEEPRETGQRYFGPEEETSGFDNNLSDVRTETGCQYFGGGQCEEVTGWSHVPACLSWTPEDVASWVESIGFTLYRECFTSNFITGRHLILIDASALPKLGITDFTHIKAIAKEIRKLLDIEDIPWNRSITLPPREQRAMFLERKCNTGVETDKLSYQEFDEDWSYLKFKPPLCNQALMLPRS